MGRRKFYETPEKLEAKINEYFRDAEYDENGVTRKEPKHLTVTGLAYFLGFEDRLSLWEYGNRPEFKHVIKKAKLRIESYLEDRLYGANVTGTIFNLKNNFGWKDQQGIEVSGSLNSMSDDELTLKIQSLLSDVGE